MNAHIIENSPQSQDKDTLAALLDLMGAIEQDIDPEEFEEVKQYILNSGITTEGFFSLLGNSFTETVLERPLVNVAIQKLTNTAIIPEYSHLSDACADIYADEDIVIEPGKTYAVSTGIAVAIPNGYVIHIYPRSGISLKTGIRLANSVGVIDAGYRDEIKVALWNTGDTAFHVEKGMRIAQMDIVASPGIEFLVVDDVKSISGDRLGGFGSSGLFDIQAEENNDSAETENNG